MKTCIRCHEIKIEDAFLAKRLVCRTCLNTEKREKPRPRSVGDGRHPPSQLGLTRQNVAPGWGF